MSASEFAPEHRLLYRWSRWCDRDDTQSILDECGLSPHGSPPAITPTGAPDEEGVTGYAREHRLPDAISPEIDLFLGELMQSKPAVFKALLLRYRRLVNGQHFRIRSERWMSAVLYDHLPPRHSYSRLATDCEIGYRLLRGFIEGTRA